MKELEISEKLRAQFAADNAFAGVDCSNDLDSGTIALPGLMFSVTAKPMYGGGSAIEFELVIWAESRAEKTQPSDPEPGLAHRQLVDAVRAKLHGAGKSALLTALNLAGGFTWRGWVASQPSNPGTEAHHFRTPVCAEGVVLVV
jgi:hypothetical protein